MAKRVCAYDRTTALIRELVDDLNDAEAGITEKDVDYMIRQTARRIVSGASK